MTNQDVSAAETHHIVAAIFQQLHVMQTQYILFHAGIIEQAEVLADL